MNAQNGEPERRVHVSWAEESSGQFEASIQVIAYDHVSLLGELAMYIGEKLGTLAPECYAAMLEGLQRLPDQVAQILVPENLAKIEEAAEAFSHNHDVSTARPASRAA